MWVCVRVQGLGLGFWSGLIFDFYDYGRFQPTTSRVGCRLYDPFGKTGVLHACYYSGLNVYAVIHPGTLL